MVGVTFECDYPPEARDRRIVSTSALPEGLPPAEIDAAVASRWPPGRTSTTWTPARWPTSTPTWW